MASTNAVDDEDVQIDPAEPLKGIIVCCTSIPAEHRVSKPRLLVLPPHVLAFPNMLSLLDNYRWQGHRARRRPQVRPHSRRYPPHCRRL